MTKALALGKVPEGSSNNAEIFKIARMQYFKSAL